jgi:hypothetical protein
VSDNKGVLALRGPKVQNFVPKSIIVGKDGARTLLRYGETNDIEAVVRSPTTHPGERIIAWELIVIPFRSSTDTGGTAFSLDGDTGAADFGMDGSMVGMLTGGFTHGKDDKGEYVDPTMSSCLPEGFERYEDEIP